MAKFGIRTLVAVFSGLAFTIVFAEAALRLFHVFSPPPSMDRFDLGQVDNTDRIRILTVGESTTAAIGSGPTANTWPSLLEKSSMIIFRKWAPSKKSLFSISAGQHRTLSSW
jgi:hypothetical protein